MGTKSKVFILWVISTAFVLGPAFVSAQGVE